MGGEKLPSVDELKAFSGQLGQYSAEGFKLELKDEGVQAWKLAIDRVVESLQQAVGAKPKANVNVGSVTADYQSAIDTATNLNTSGASVHANIEASLEAAKALQSFVQAAFDTITKQSETAVPGR